MMIIKKKLMRKQHFLLISGKHCSRNGIVPLNPLGVKESIAAKAAVKAIINSLIIIVDIYYNIDITVYHQYCVPTILQVVTRICFWKKLLCIVFKIKVR